MHRYIVRVEVERSPAVVSALTAASMTVQEPAYAELANTTLELEASPQEETVTEVLDALSPPLDDETTTVAVNAPSGDEALTKVREALGRWGGLEVRLVGQEPL